MFFYDAQMENIALQSIRVFNHFKIKNAQGELSPVACRWGEFSKMASLVLAGNSENVMQSCPFISVWFQSLNLARNRTQNPSGISEVVVNEKLWDDQLGRYVNEPGGNRYVIERLMPTPIDITLQVDIWTTLQSNRWQLLEQIIPIFNPSIDFQRNENPFDWTSLTTMELKSITYSNRSIPLGPDTTIDVATLLFDIPTWINPPAKITHHKFISAIKTKMDLVDLKKNKEWDENNFNSNIITIDTCRVKIIDGSEAILLSKHGDLYDKNGNEFDWQMLMATTLFSTNVKFLRLRPITTTEYVNADIFATWNQDPNHPNKLNIQIIPETLPTPTIPTIFAVIDPTINYIGNVFTPQLNQLYIISETILPGTDAWGAFGANKNSIIKYIGNENWEVSVDYNNLAEGNIAYVQNPSQLLVSTMDGWQDAISGVYHPGYWRLQANMN